MAQSNKPELHLYVGCQDDRTNTWALDPPMGRNGFRIVVHCRRAQVTPSLKSRSSSSYFDAIAHVALAIFTFWRTGH